MPNLRLRPSSVHRVQYLAEIYLEMEQEPMAMWCVRCCLLTMTVFVVCCQRDQVERFGEIRSRRYGAALLGFKLCHVLAELCIHHGDLGVLHNEAFNALH